MDYFDVLFAKTNGISSSTCYNEIEAMLKSTVGHSSKNLLPITLESGSYTAGGANLTYTVDKAAGTITLNGNTRTSGTDYLTVFSDVNGEVAGKLYLSGGYNDGARLFCRDLTDDVYPKQWDGTTTSVTSKGEHDSIQELLIAGHNNEVRLRLYAGYEFNNAVLKPMLRDGSISDDTFEPYVTPTDEKKQDKIKSIYVAPSLEDATDEIVIPRSNYIDFFIVVCLAQGNTDKAVTFIVPQELFGYPCVNGDFSITGHIVDSTHNKLTFGFPNTFTAGKIIRVLGIPNISYVAEE